MLMLIYKKLDNQFPYLMFLVTRILLWKIHHPIYLITQTLLSKILNLYPRLHQDYFHKIFPILNLRQLKMAVYLVIPFPAHQVDYSLKRTTLIRQQWCLNLIKLLHLEWIVLYFLTLKTHLLNHHNQPKIKILVHLFHFLEVLIKTSLKIQTESPIQFKKLLILN